MELLVMSILKYLERRNGLPDPRGSLSNSVSARAISTANAEVEAEIARQKKETTKKRGPYTR